MDAKWSAPAPTGSVAALTVGTMNFGKRTLEPEARNIVARAIERGLTFFDTANAYEKGESERILGRALGKRRGECLVATKVGFGRVGREFEGLSKETVSKACDESLSRLKSDYVDLYYLHVPDPKTPIEETLEAVESLLDSKKILHFGVSNYASWQILEIFGLCDRAGMPRPIVAQQLYNLVIRQLDVEYFKFTRKHPLHTTVYNALAGGLLARDHELDAIPAGSRFDNNALYQRRYWSRAMFEFVRELRALASEESLSLADFSYAWLARRPGVDSILLGPGSVAHLDAAIDAVGKELRADSLSKVDELHRAFTGTDATYAR